MNNIKEDLSSLKVGDKVYSLIHGWGEILEITPQANYPLVVVNDYHGHSTLHTFEGKYYNMANENQTLFTYNPFEKDEFPKWMEVDHRKVWIVYKSELNTYLAFDDKMCDTGTARWYKGHEIREISESTEMTVKEIEEKLGISNLKIVK